MWPPDSRHCFSVFFFFFLFLKTKKGGGGGWAALLSVHVQVSSFMLPQVPQAAGRHGSSTYTTPSSSSNSSPATVHCGYVDLGDSTDRPGQVCMYCTSVCSRSDEKGSGEQQKKKTRPRRRKQKGKEEEKEEKKYNRRGGLWLRIGRHIIDVQQVSAPRGTGSCIPDGVRFDDGAGSILPETFIGDPVVIAPCVVEMTGARIPCMVACMADGDHEMYTM